MTGILIFGAAVVALLVLSGRAATMNNNDWLALGLALVAANFARGGNGWMAGIFAAVAAYAFIVHGNGNVSHEVTAARKLLGVSKSADKQAINRAWKRALETAHPDHGGDADFARELNQARDILIINLESRTLPEK